MENFLKAVLAAATQSLPDGLSLSESGRALTICQYWPNEGCRPLALMLRGSRRVELAQSSQK
ncbi:hypothetical protein PSEUDO9AZ_20053 [Pseudomonas sp. 9AZ]|nr:hypothetical protein PSEUDO9AZ_20053 [Pseudomonas sp. 9AZ]